jgi:hypothetical protein
MREIYRGVDLVYYGNPSQLEYDFVVAPGGDVSAIRIEWSGVKSRRVDTAGDLVLETSGSRILQRRPVAYQTVDGRRVEVAAKYKLSQDGVAFELGQYDRGETLVIDPSLSYSTYLGGAGLDDAAAVAVDQFFTAFVAGTTASANFPTSTSALDGTLGGQNDAYVTRFDVIGASLLYSTFLGGAGLDNATAIAVDDLGTAFVTGETQSPDFPLRNAFKDHPDGAFDGFLVMINPSGSSVLFGTYFGGVARDVPTGIGMDRAGAVYIAGYTNSNNFPTTAGAFQTEPTLNTIDGFLQKYSINSGGFATLIYSTMVEGSGGDVIRSLAVDPLGNAYVTGITDSGDFPVSTGAFRPTLVGGGDVFVTKVNPAGSGILYSTFIGGTGSDDANGIGVDLLGRAWVGGQTGSPNYPTTPGAAFPAAFTFADGFVSRVNSRGTALAYSTYLGGRFDDNVKAVRVDSGGYAYVIGDTFSENFPVTFGTIQQFKGGLRDGYLAVFNPAGTALHFSSYLGGANNDFANALALDRMGNAYVAGQTFSQNFPALQGSYRTTPAGGGDAFLSRVTNLFIDTCLGTASSATNSFGAAGGTGTVTVGGVCQWFGVASGGAVTTTGTVSGSGTGAFSFTVAPNAHANPRTGSLNVAGNIVPVIQSGASTTPPFDDVPLGHQYFSHIALLKGSGITSGCSATSYCPDASTTRSQMAVFIIRGMFGGDNFPFRATPYFTDVPATHPHFKWVQKMRELGITSGCSATTYCPDNSVTRGQMAVFLIRSRIGNEFSISQTPYFTDVPVNYPYFSFIQKMRELGITTGCTATAYCPESPNTRGQMAVFLTRGFLTPW